MTTDAVWVKGNGYEFAIEPKAWLKRRKPFSSWFPEDKNPTFRVRITHVAADAQPNLRLTFLVRFSNGARRELETLDIAQLAKANEYGYLQDVYVPVPGRTQIGVIDGGRWWPLFTYEVVSEAKMWSFLIGPLSGLLLGIAGTAAALGAV